MSDDTTGTADFAHRPVMVDEIVDLFGPAPSGVVVDATVGGAGHSTALLERHDHLRIVGLDQDETAVATATERVASFGERASVHHTRFDRAPDVLGDLGIDRLSGFLLDLGVSSPQLDRAERGFSYRFDAPLDMRMDQTRPLTAADVVNEYDERTLAGLLRENGGERHAGRIARAIVAARPLSTTAELVEVLLSAIPARDRGGRHPARRAFQAIRIEVNDELEILGSSIDRLIDLLAPEGRGAVLAYHSGEDRIVKDRLREAETGGCTCPPQLPCGCGAVRRVTLLHRGARRPGAAELSANPRAESARLRALQRLDASSSSDEVIR